MMIGWFTFSLLLYRMGKAGVVTPFCSELCRVSLVVCVERGGLAYLI